MADDDTLWIDPQRLKFFKIPDDLELAEGDTVLYTLTGRARRLDPGVLGAWEISAEEVQAHLQADLFQFAIWAKEKTSGNIPTDHESVVQQSLHITAHDLSNLLGHLAQALADTISDDETRLERAHEWMHTLRLKAQEWGADWDPIMEMWPHAIRAAYLASDNKVAFEKIAEWLGTLATRLGQLHAGNAENLVQALTDLNRLLGTWWKTEETIEERRRRYREMARQAMPEIPRPDIKKMIQDSRTGR